MTALAQCREAIRQQHRAPDEEVIAQLCAHWAPSEEVREHSCEKAAAYAAQLRQSTTPSPMEAFLGQYGLSTDEGVALMCLAEALLRVPDTETIDALIEDKITPHAWGAHLGKASSSLVNASTWALMLTGRVLDDGDNDGLAAVLHGAVKRLGEPVIRLAVEQAMKELGRQFVLGRSIEEAVKNGRAHEQQGYSYSYDMLGEAAMTASDAHRYFTEYQNAICALAGHATAGSVRDNPGISVKLSALHPCYDALKKDRVMAELVPGVTDLARAAAQAHIGFNIDAEEADRLDLSLDVIEAVLRDPALAGWDGFGVVVQAYGKRALPVIDWLDTLAEDVGRNIMVRLVKGAYWDTEIKRAQVDGVAGYPVFSQKRLTDVSYICCAKRLLASARIYPQFATHNAHSVASILEIVEPGQLFEFQRLHGMGEEVHDAVLRREETRCRIYAPVGAHKDLLAYLVRRLLENGANSSFVNQITDVGVPIEEVVADPFAARNDVPIVAAPVDIFQPGRTNARGWDIRDPADAAAFEAARAPYKDHRWTAAPLLAVQPAGREPHAITNPADCADCVGQVSDAAPGDIQAALEHAKVWDVPAQARADILRRAADLFEEAHGQVIALLAREAGKTALDAIAELREAVDFLRYYASEAERLSAQSPRGVISCISPWNFPLAIFTGQIAAALAAGNAVLAKPAEPTPLIAHLATQLLHQAGVPRAVLQFLPGTGHVVGAAIVSDPRVNGVCFTGSTATAQSIHRSMAQHLDPSAPLIAETGGLNAMIVDSTALPEQAVRDIVASAFQSAGQRCSALRILYVQEDVASGVTEMLKGAMKELEMGRPWDFSCDVGPVITQDAQTDINAYIADAQRGGRLIKQLTAPSHGSFVRPSLISVAGIDDLPREIFGPVLHVATYKVEALDGVLQAINARGFGLTFGLHSRIDDRVEQVISQLKVGNIYVNRNQIGAVVGSQPFGGEGLSGTGPKAGGPHYVKRFCAEASVTCAAVPGPQLSRQDVQRCIDAALPSPDTPLSVQDMPGPTGESNRLSAYPRGRILCLGPGDDAAQNQAQIVSFAGCIPIVLPGALCPSDLATLSGFDGVVSWADAATLRSMRKALAAREGAILPLITQQDFAERCILERHVCIDTTAAGGNTKLMSAAA
ncbi:MAG: bifunctional proline dehydrogenase/L-glutamate gamma-semialdehyde dehydrogenase PutA [Pseudomonadota bacterium]